MIELSMDEVDLALLQRLQQDATPSNQALAANVGISPATALRRIKRLTDAGLIEKQVAVLQPDRLAQHTGHGLTAIAEISLDKQGAEHLDAFEALLLRDPEVQQCYRVSPGPDFVVVLTVRDMPAYHALAQRLFTQQANVRNVRVFFSVKRAKFGTALPLP
jgi:Lrp/AsnC family transcriptional regulator, leucine-responsive regulatory protein